MLASDKNVVVVNVFAGIPDADLVLTDWDRMTGATDSRTRMWDRLREDERALSSVGRRATNLGFREKLARQRSPSIAALIAAAAESVPRASKVYAPVGIGGHVDHLLVRDMACELWRGGVPLELYAELPYAVAYGWPSWVTGQMPGPQLLVDAQWEPYLVSAPWRRDWMKPRVAQLNEEKTAMKLNTLRTYKTQYPALTGGVRDSLADPLVLGFEVFWSLEPAAAVDCHRR